MDLKRRISLYLLGVLIGGGVAYHFYGDRLLNAQWTPKERIRQRLASTLVRSTDEATAVLGRFGVSLPEVRDGMPAAQVLLNETQRSGDTLFYRVRNTLNGADFLFVVRVLEDHRRDSTATLMEVWPQ